jgi:putative beta-1,4-xylosyltransferase IRX9
VRGPACSSSAVTGWFSQDLGNVTAAASTPSTARARARPSREVDVHGFAFNSSVLWDPERWGRYPTSEPDKSQVRQSITHPSRTYCFRHDMHV